ncbi:MAG: hypothetical protein V8S89_00890 [Oscillospiraceae bacterium]
MKPIVYIDGKEGTTGLQIYDRIGARDDITLLLIDEDKRKDPVERQKLMNAADLVFLCLPDAAAREAVTLVTSLPPASSMPRRPTVPAPAGLWLCRALAPAPGGHPGLAGSQTRAVTPLGLYRHCLPLGGLRPSAAGCAAVLPLHHRLLRWGQEDDRPV